MPSEGSNDFDLGAEIRRNRERLGLSHARIAELVGRSPSTVRAWERGKSTPTDADVLRSLAAVLDLDEERVLSTADPRSQSSGGTTGPRVGGSVREAYASLAREQAERPDVEPRWSRGAEDSSNDADDVTTDTPQRGAHVRPSGPSSGGEAAPLLWDRVKGLVARPPRRQSAPATSSQTALSTLPQRPPSPSYVESDGDRLAYRIRAVLTAVGVLLAVVVLAWAAGNLLEALGEFWDVLTSNL